MPVANYTAQCPTELYNNSAGFGAIQLQLNHTDLCLIIQWKRGIKVALLGLELETPILNVFNVEKLNHDLLHQCQAKIPRGPVSCSV